MMRAQRGEGGRPDTFGAWLRDRRLATGLSLRDLGTRADVDFTYLSRVEAGKVPLPAPEVVRRLVATLGDDGEAAALAEGERRLPIREIRAVLRAYPELAALIERLAHDGR